MYPPGLRLRRIREDLGLTYRDVEKASYEIAVKRGRQDFILHISRLADIENRDVVPSLHKLYSLATILHLDPMEISNWYDAPFRQTLQDGAMIPPPRTHLGEAPPTSLHQAPQTSPGTGTTELINEPPDSMGALPKLEASGSDRYRYGYVGLCDRRMMPLLRPGSIVLIDTALRRIEDADWSSEYDRPMYFVELRGGYRCGWFQKDKSRLIMQPHTLSRCAPEAWRTPEDAEVVGQVVGIVTYLNEPWSYRPGEVPPGRLNWNSKAP